MDTHIHHPDTELGENLRYYGVTRPAVCLAQAWGQEDVQTPPPWARVICTLSPLMASLCIRLRTLTYSTKRYTEKGRNWQHRHPLYILHIGKI